MSRVGEKRKRKKKKKFYLENGRANWKMRDKKEKKNQPQELKSNQRVCTDVENYFFFCTENCGIAILLKYKNFTKLILGSKKNL